MQNLAGAIRIFSALLLLSLPATAGEGDVGMMPVKEHFTFNASDPGNAIPGSKNKPLPQTQIPSSIPRSSSVQFSPMTNQQKFDHYLKTTYGPQAFAYNAFTAGVAQARGSVYEWGGGMEGYGKRYASSFGRRAIFRSLWQGFGILAHEDPRYFRSDSSNTWSRTLHAASQTFISHKDSGGTRFGYTKVGGAFGAAVISRQWHPDRYQNMGDYFTSTATSLGWNMAKNVFNEFWPDIKHRLPF